MPGKLESLDEVGAFIMGTAEDAGLDKRKAYKLRLAVDEITTNAIVHGYQEAGIEGDITIEAVDSPEDLTIYLYDTGQAYDPDEAVDHTDIQKPMEERNIGGLGV